MNYVADEVLEFLKEKHTKVYRNRSPQNAESPYVVFRLESVITLSQRRFIFAYRCI